MVAGWCLPIIAVLAALPASADDCRDGMAFAARCETRLIQLKNEISTMIRQPTCNTAAECRTVGVGAKLCGGPGAYVAYAPAVLNEKLFLTKVQDYNRLKAQTLGRVSDCQRVIDPGAMCLSRQCMLRGTGANPAGR